MTGPTPVRTRGRIPTFLIAGAGVVLVVMVALWLVWPTPPSATVLHTTTPHGDVTVTVDRSKVGATPVTVDVAGEPASVTVQPVMPHMGYSAPEIPAGKSGTGQYSAPDVSFMMTGVWEIRVRISQAPGDSDVVVVPVNVSG